MNQILIFVSFVLVFALVQAVHNYPERRGCRVVQPGLFGHYVMLGYVMLGYVRLG